MTNYWTPEALARLEARLAGGIPAGLGTADRACIVASVRLALDPSASLRDELPCASSALRGWAIAINDWDGWPSASARAAGLREVALLLPGTASLDWHAVMGVLTDAALAAAGRALRIHAPARLDAAGLSATATRLRGLPQMGAAAEAGREAGTYVVAAGASNASRVAADALRDAGAYAVAAGLAAGLIAALGEAYAAVAAASAGSAAKAAKAAADCAADPLAEMATTIAAVVAGIRALQEAP